ncbi:uncharacterized protein LOC144619226 [Crassostrea virginica]
MATVIRNQAISFDGLIQRIIDSRTCCQLFGSRSVTACFNDLDCLIIIVAFFAYAQSSPVPSIDVNSGHTHIRAVVEEETTLNVTNFPINSTSAPRVSENTTLSEEELTLNFTTDPLQDFETTDISDDGNASQEPTENVDHSNKKCASPETLNYLETPCGTKVLPGPRRCDVNNLFRVKLGAQMLLATLSNLTYHDDAGTEDIHLHRLNKTIPPVTQLEELEESLQIYFMYISEAKAIYSTKLSQLNSLHFDFILKNLLFALCNLDNGTPKELPTQTTCLSHDPITFFSQTIYIINSLQTDARIATSWSTCSSK